MTPEARRPFIRAIANTLYDKGYDPIYKDDFQLVTVLLAAGWTNKYLHECFMDAKLMAFTRFENDRRTRLKNLQESQARDVGLVSAIDHDKICPNPEKTENGRSEVKPDPVRLVPILRS